MTPSLRRLKIAVCDFASRPIEEDIDPSDLQDVLYELEAELEMLYETPEERAASDKKLAESIKSISEMYRSRS